MRIKYSILIMIIIILGLSIFFMNYFSIPFLNEQQLLIIFLMIILISGIVMAKTI
jgi:hypothetical protein